jgi:hypothetical protein
MKKQFTHIFVKIVSFKDEDIITTSYLGKVYEVDNVVAFDQTAGWLQ